jgi:hypothetical protein
MDGVIEKPIPTLVLTKQRRREVCIHEAAHAVITGVGENSMSWRKHALGVLPPGHRKP